MNIDVSNIGKLKKKIIGCEAVIEEMQPLFPPDIPYEILDFGLHFRPEKLKNALQEAIDKSAEDAEVLLLGYGLCSNGAVGLKAPETATLVIPKVHDCIAIFLGSHAAYMEKKKEENGTFFLAKGFIEVGDTPLDEYKRTVERYGKNVADRVMATMFAHYKRTLFINTGYKDIDKYRKYTQRLARQFKMQYEEVRGSRNFIKKILYGPWDEEFIIVRPGETIVLEQFLNQASKKINYGFYQCSFTQPWMGIY